MPDIRFVCLSDVHFGAENSILSCLVKDDLFDDTILYQVGNHDHHLWETARELQYANVVREYPPGTLLPIPWHTTKLYYREDTRPVHCELLERVARRRSHRRRINIRVSYPNM